VEDVNYNSSNIKMVLENYLKEITVHQVRKHFANVGFWEVPRKIDYVVHI